MDVAQFLSGRLVIDEIPVSPAGGRIGMTHMPGRTGADARKREWRRDLAGDLSAIEDRGVGLVISLVEQDEFAALGVPDLPRKVAGCKFKWRHFPIANMETPSSQSAGRLQALLDEVETELVKGGFVVFHCAAGLGRTGTMAALVLIDRFRVSPEEAVAVVRAARPGTIESDNQMRFLLDLGPKP